MTTRIHRTYNADEVIIDNRLTLYPHLLWPDLSGGGGWRWRRGSPKRFALLRFEDGPNRSFILVPFLQVV
jgi:hypothetical protein